MRFYTRCLMTSMSPRCNSLPCWSHGVVTQRSALRDSASFSHCLPSTRVCKFVHAHTAQHLANQFHAYVVVPRCLLGTITVCSSSEGPPSLQFRRMCRPWTATIMYYTGGIPASEPGVDGCVCVRVPGSIGPAAVSGCTRRGLATQVVFQAA